MACMRSEGGKRGRRFDLLCASRQKVPYSCLDRALLVYCWQYAWRLPASPLCSPHGRTQRPGRYRNRTSWPSTRTARRFPSVFQSSPRSKGWASTDRHEWLSWPPNAPMPRRLCVIGCRPFPTMCPWCACKTESWATRCRPCLANGMSNAPCRFRQRWRPQDVAAKRAPADFTSDRGPRRALATSEPHSAPLPTSWHTRHRFERAQTCRESSGRNC